ncbi:MAG: redox-regulated ATPase YchF [Acetobacteraceae bacterium]
MGFNCGIVGLPNVGKSTLFNALVETAAAEAANYPFCTIEPNIGRVGVPDRRLDALAEIAHSARAVPTSLEFVDIAGLVRGASKGEGLGNQFLGHIREVDAIVHVLRCFENPNIVHVEGSIDPLRDAGIVETELMLADLESLERRLPGLEKRARGGDRESQATRELIQPILALLRDGKPARAFASAPPVGLRRLQLLTAKPLLYVCNVGEEARATGNTFSEAVARYAANERARAVVVSAALEAEIARLPTAERAEFLAGLGLADSGLDRIVRAGYKLLHLLTFFTAGPKETRAWTIERGTRAPQAAGVIHGDFERGFIAAETISYADYIACKGEGGARDAGRLRIEGRDYVVQDGDVMLFRFNV